MDISKLLLKFDEEELPENFVSIATRIEEKKSTHAAILIRHKGINYLHHFPGNTNPIVVDNFDENGWYIYKIIDEIGNDENEVGSFLQYCRRICRTSKITYSYISDGSSYSNRGDFISRIGLPELGTCVGFCVNTLTNTLIDVKESYLELNDWDDSDLIEWVDKWSLIQVEKNYPDLDWTLFNAFKKRITPLEYLCSSFINEFPIRKNKIDEIKHLVEKEIENKF